MTRLTSLIFVAAFFAGCGGNHSSSTAGQFCPCAPGFSCDTTTNMCVVPAADDASCSATCSTPAGTVEPLTSVGEIYAAVAGTWQICTDLADWKSMGAPGDVIGIEFGPASTAPTATGGTVGGDAYYLVQPEASSGPVRGSGFAYQLTYSVWQEGAQSFQFNIFMSPSSNSLAGGLRYSPCPSEIEIDLGGTSDFSSVLVHF